MSSQGPASGTLALTGTGFTSVAGTCILTGTASQIPPVYQFSKLSIRDASDWIKYKKQALIYNDAKTSKSNDPWFVHGNDFRLEWLNGSNKCVPCQANAISGSIF